MSVAVVAACIAAIRHVSKREGLTMNISQYERDFYMDVRRIADNLENVAQGIEQLRVELKKKRFDDAEQKRKI